MGLEPESADMQQRLRVAADTLFKHLVMAGAGSYHGTRSGSLIHRFAPADLIMLDRDESALHAVQLRFSKSGEYEDFDRTSPLTRSRGKEVIVRDIRARAKGKAAFVGDGASDLEAKPAVDLFIGFGGVHTRPRVRENADVFVPGPRLDDILPYLI